jgi:hypothetical protein
MVSWSDLNCTADAFQGGDLSGAASGDDAALLQQRTDCSKHGPDGVIAGVLVSDPVQQAAKRNGQHALRHAGEDGLRQAWRHGRHM